VLKLLFDVLLAASHPPLAFRIELMKNADVALQTVTSSIDVKASNSTDITPHNRMNKSSS